MYIIILCRCIWWCYAIGLISISFLFSSLSIFAHAHLYFDCVPYQRLLPPTLNFLLISFVALNTHTNIERRERERERERGRALYYWMANKTISKPYVYDAPRTREKFFLNFCSSLPCCFGLVLLFAFQQSNIYLTSTAESKLLCDGCCIFLPSLGCCTLQTPVEILFFLFFMPKS